MVEAKTELNGIVKRYLKELNKLGIHVERVMLFGSHAIGAQKMGSDIDLLVISPDWKRYNERERLEILGIAAVRILEPIQAVGFTPEEINRQEISHFWLQILREKAVPI